MDYALAKELKDAGFIFSKKRELLRLYEKAYAPATDGMLSPDYVLVPTLEELIEACGGALHTLSHTSGMMSFRKAEDLYWDAQGYQAGKTIATGHAGPKATNLFLEPKTPSEAVARLWLALHKS